MKRNVVVFGSAVFLFSVVATIARPRALDPLRFTVHEWGTFTSIAGENGQAIAWRTYGGPGDLPCFVNTFGGFKGGVFGKVRMETPVVYFYSPRDLSANVKVAFPRGTITEWFPKAALSPLSHAYDRIEWRDVRVTPSASPDFPMERSRNHYYAARQTHAAPLQVGSEKEKFLFYRGVGNFTPPISVKTVADGRIVVKNLGADPVGGVVLFENRDGKIGYRIAGVIEGEVTLGSELRSGLGALLVDLENILVGQGLFREEANAMIETWRDSWFEEGARLFYIVPRRLIDSVLPLDIQPAPSEIARVFVGRMEIVTPAIQEDVKQAFAKNDRLALEKYGRFLEPIAKRIGVAGALLDSVYVRFSAQAATCSR
jgi:hypothetical protein